MKKIFKILLTITFSLLFVGFCYFFFYANSLSGVNPRTVSYYKRLKKELVRKGYSPAIMIISGRRARWHNQLLTAFGAARNSQHLRGNALDIMVMDVNNDRVMDQRDVQIVVKILEQMIGDEGGIGTYTSEKWLWNRQMVHIDCRGKRARWSR